MQKAGLFAVLRSQSPGAWAEVVRRVAYVPTAYTETMMDYQKAYVFGAGMEMRDYSLILYHDKRPAGVWPLCLRKRDVWELGSNEGPVLPPLYISSLGPRSIKSQTTACLNFLEELGHVADITAWQGIEPFVPVQALSEWHCQVMRRGAEAEIRHSLYVDLSMELSTIKSCFRKSYRALINSGSKLWQVGILIEADASRWKEFRELHSRVAGRATRPLETWDRQLESIKEGASFLVYLKNEQNRMVGGGYFQISRDEGIYAVAAYDRDLFDKPLGHVVQYHAIQEMQRRGLKWYCIGTRLYPSDQPAPTAKELAISEFKEGFATHYFVRFMLSCPLSSASASTQD